MSAAGGNRRRSLVEAVLELLRAHLPDFAVETGEARRRTARRSRRRGPRRPPGSAGAGPSPGPSPDDLLAACYAELGVPYGADLGQVRRAWRRLVREHHPDLSAGDPQAREVRTERLQRLNHARDELGKRLEVRT